MANKLLTGLTTTPILCGFDYMVVERLTGTSAAVTTNARLSSVYNYITSQPLTATVADGSITEAKLADNSVSTIKLKDRSVTTIKIAQGAVTGYELANNAVSAVHIYDNSITAPKLNTNVAKVNGGLSVDSSGIYVNTPIRSYIVNSTLALADANAIVEANNASSMTITVPVNASVAFPIGTNIVIYQKGAGQVTISAATGVTLLNNTGKVKTSAQNAAAALFKVATDTWLLAGDLV
jgi:hypothetical protein